MGVFSRSWEITKASFKVIKKEKELIVFPILSIVFSILFLLAIIFPYLLNLLLGKVTNLPVFGAIQYIIIFLIYLGLAFIATFFNVCVVYTATMAFSNKNPTFGRTMAYAFSKIHLIFVWSLVAATVGLILKLIESMAERSKGGGRIVIHIIRGILGFIWGVVTIFVIPSMVYHNLGPFAAIKKSVNVLKKTWGEYLVRVFGVGMFIFLFWLAGVIVLIPLVLLGIGIGAWILVPVILLGIVYFVTVALIFGVVEKIYDTALYVYAETGHVVKGYEKDMMANAFKAKKTKVQAF